MQTAWQEEQSAARWDGDAISMTQGNPGHLLELSPTCLPLKLQEPVIDPNVC